MADRPMTASEINATFDAIENARLAREERELRAEEEASAAPCPGVGEYGHGLTGKTVHWRCCPASA